MNLMDSGMNSQANCKASNSEMRWAIKRPDEGARPGSRLAELTNKAALQALLRGDALNGCPTLPLRHTTALPWFPCCIKPNAGTGGRGFRTFFSVAEWSRSHEYVESDYVVQPFLRGTEYRVSISASRAIAVAELIARYGDLCCWRSANVTTLPARVGGELTKIAESFGLPALGFDVLHVHSKWYLLDVNPRPDMSPHGYDVSGL